MDANGVTAWRRWAHWIGSGARYVLPVALSVALVWWLSTKIEIRQVKEILRHGVNYWWIVAMMLITGLSHVIRGIRWGIQLGGIGVRESVTALSVSIFGTYALNLIVPRGGEVWRCVFIARRDDVAVSKVVGTLVGDRASDIVVVMLLTGLALVVAHPALMNFVHHYAVGRDVMGIIDSPAVWIGVLTAVTGLWALMHYCAQFKVVAEMKRSLHEIGAGFMVLFSMGHKWEYLWLTLGIWVCYFMETYTCFHAFGFTVRLITEPGTAWGLIPGLVVFVFGSMSMAIPSNGGLGAWNVAVMFGLSLYGIPSTEGAAYSLLMWSAQAAMLVALGIFCIVYIALNPKNTRAANH